MFAYLTKKNNKDIIVYRRNILYFDEDNSDDDEYLFNTQTIANWANEYNVKLVSFIPQDEIVVTNDDHVPPLFSYS